MRSGAQRAIQLAFRTARSARWCFHTPIWIHVGRRRLRLSSDSGRVPPIWIHVGRRRLRLSPDSGRVPHVWTISAAGGSDSGRAVPVRCLPVPVPMCVSREVLLPCRARAPARVHTHAVPVLRARARAIHFSPPETLPCPCALPPRGRRAYLSLQQKSPPLRGQLCAEDAELRKRQARARDESAICYALYIFPEVHCTSSMAHGQRSSGQTFSETLTSLPGSREGSGGTVSCSGVRERRIL